MAVIAADALIFAAFDPFSAIYVTSVLTGFAGLIAGLARSTGMTATRAATWVAAAYPWFILAALYLTWAAAWVALGHPPRAIRDDPKELGLVVLVVHALTWFLMTGIPLAVMTCLILTCGEAIKAAQRGGRGTDGVIAGIILIPAVSWGGAFLLFSIDVGRAVGWFLD